MSKRIGMILGVVAFLALAAAAQAAQVNILYNSQVQERLSLPSESLLDVRTTITSADQTRTNYNVRVRVFSGDIDYALKDIFIYECRKEDPVACAAATPTAYQETADHLRSWTAVSDREGSDPVAPRTGNLMILARLEGPNGDVWQGSFVHIRRARKADDPQVIPNPSATAEINARTLESVQYIKNFISAYGVLLPFNSQFVSGISFRANRIYSLSASAEELGQSPPVLHPSSSSPQLNSITSDFNIIFSDVGGEIADAMTAVPSPSPVLGNRRCEEGEDSFTACYDCGCIQGFYCDLADPADLSTGVCKNPGIMTLTAVPVSTSLSVSDCTQDFSLNITATVNNPPSGLPSSLTGIAAIDGSEHDADCVRSGQYGKYACTVRMAPTVQCGGSKEDTLTSIAGNSLTFRLAYTDGPNQAVRDARAPFSNIKVTYNCGCSSGSYCDSGTNTCETDDLSVSVVSMRTKIDNYQPPTDHITFTVQVNNQPTGLRFPYVDFTLGELNIDTVRINQSVTGKINCPPSGSDTYECDINFSIPNYNSANTYLYKGNRLAFRFEYTDGIGNRVAKDIQTSIPDVTITSQTCGDHVANQGETQSTCCVDVLCSSGSYCDTGTSACKAESGIGLSVDSLRPGILFDAEKAHTINISLTINNTPANFTIVDRVHKIGGQQSGYDLECSVTNKLLGRVRCLLSVPPKQDCPANCAIRDNSLELTISYPDGDLPVGRTKTLSAAFQDIQITPVYHCGDGRQEVNVNESVLNCCVDFPCRDAPAFGPNYYCDYDPQSASKPQCRALDGIRLVIQSPTTPVSLDSCETTNEVHVLAHIENEPAKMKLENVAGIINGENAEDVTCRESRSFTQGSNRTYNCSISIPAEPTCSRGDVYEYGPNSIALAITFNTGNSERPELRTLLADLPNITARQGTQSMFDISEQLRDDIEEALKDIQRHAKKLEKNVEQCTKLLLVGAAANFLAPIAGMGIGYAKTSGKDQVTGVQGASLTGDEKSRIIASETSTWATVGKAAFDSINVYCQAVTQMRLIEIQIDQIHILNAQIDACLALTQHVMDTGGCRGQETACFGQIQGCISQIQQMGAVATGISNQMIQVGNSLSSQTDRIVQSFQRNTNAVWNAQNRRFLGGPADANTRLNVQCQENTINGHVCCEYQNTRAAGQQREAILRVNTPLGSQRCREYGVALDSVDNLIGRDLLNGPTAISSILRKNFGVHSFQLICDGQPVSGEVVTINYLDDPDDGGPLPCTGVVDNSDLVLNVLAVQGDTVTVEASARTGDSCTIAWGDDTEPLPFTGGQSIVHTYANPGEYTIKLSCARPSGSGTLTPVDLPRDVVIADTSVSSTQPAILLLDASEITDSSAKISWTSSGACVGSPGKLGAVLKWEEAGQPFSGSPGKTTAKRSQTESDSITIGDGANGAPLEPGKTYTVLLECTGTDESSRNIRTTTFTTLGGVETAQPQVTLLESIRTSDTEAEIIWSTNTGCDSVRIEWGEDQRFLNGLLNTAGPTQADIENRMPIGAIAGRESQYRLQCFDSGIAVTFGTGTVSAQAGIRTVAISPPPANTGSGSVAPPQATTGNTRTIGTLITPTVTTSGGKTQFPGMPTSNRFSGPTRAGIQWITTSHCIGFGTTPGVLITYGINSLTGSGEIRTSDGYDASSILIGGGVFGESPLDPDTNYNYRFVCTGDDGSWAAVNSNF
ncbi:MAG: hypothetical protein HY518_03445 [Candidatus Aenigmarchaeota archaeon]|nr:hypothetical protein [Candidatus Aenigmarchaeota archaeon]